jgi:succinyl-diaminopimelate desuccinylase
MELSKYVERNKEAMLKTLSGALQIRSVRGPAEPGKPFGEGPSRCLDYILKVCRDLGFRTKNVDNYMGWAEIGEGNEMVGILGHLDVVPEGSGWDRDPYSGDVDGTYVYGRGAMDDKGPSIAALYGMKAILDAKLPLKRRIRFLFGTNEETGCQDMEYYLKKGGEIPVCGFTPDAEYPLINGEKGIIDAAYTKTFVQTGPLKLVRLIGGTAINIVPALAEAEFICPQEMTEDLIAEFNGKHGLVVEKIPDGVKVSAHGREAHGAFPEKGENAIGKLLLGLALWPLEGELKAAVGFAASHIGLEVHGESLGIALEDSVSGKLSFNLGMIEGNEEHLTLKINYRYPVTKHYEDCAPLLTARFKAAGFELTSEKHKEALFVDEKTPYVQTLLQVYHEMTGLEARAISIGGGTYAKSVPNIVAFGPIFPGDTVREHLPNEFWEIEILMKNAQIYAEAMYQLAR